jgi:hypothetical protein
MLIIFSALFNDASQLHAAKSFLRC